MDTELRNAVIERDARAMWEAAGVNQSFATWRRMHPVICIVRLIDPDNETDCGGVQTVDHVHGQPPVGTMQKTNEGGFGKRAPDDMGHLVAMCEKHNVWSPPSKQLRNAERAYLGGTVEEPSPEVIGENGPEVIAPMVEDAETASDRAPLQEAGAVEQQEG